MIETLLLAHSWNHHPFLFACQSSPQRQQWRGVAARETRPFVACCKTSSDQSFNRLCRVKAISSKVAIAKEYRQRPKTTEKNTNLVHMQVNG